MIVLTDSTVTAAYINRQGGLPSPVQAGNHSLAVGPPPLPLAQSHACARGTELRGGHHVEGGPSAGGMETPSGGGFRALASLRQGRGRPVRVQGVNTLPTLLLSEERRSPLGLGCSGSSMAQGSALCLSPLHSSPASSLKSSGGACGGNTGGSSVAPHGMVLSNSTSAGRTAMGAPALEGPTLPGERSPVPPLSSGAQAGGLAPERDRLLALGLPEPVVATIQQARAPSTRAAYSYRWQLFTAWCGSNQADPLLSLGSADPAVFAVSAGGEEGCGNTAKIGGSNQSSADQ